MTTTRLSRAAAVSGLLATTLAVAQPRPSTPTPPPPPSTPTPPPPTPALPPIESRLEAGFRVVARWDLPPDRSGVPIALAQVRRSAPGVADEVKCVVAWLRDGALQVDIDDDLAFGDSPAACLSAGRLGDRWVIARWAFGGYGDGASRVNESNVRFYAIIDGQLREVGGSGVDEFTVLGSSDTDLSIRVRGGPNRRWVWSPDRTRLVAPPPPPRAALSAAVPSAAMPSPRLSIPEVFGLSPLSVRAREALLTLRGDPSTPPSRFDHTSLKMFRPRLALPLWAGRPAHGRLIPIYNLVSHVRPPLSEGWSVRVTTARDFLGTQLTYDSHNGTDFAVPVGTTVVAAAPGTVLRVSSEFNRGGLKVFIDHGAGLVTTYNHLGRALVRVGQRVRRAEPIGISAYSGLDGLTTFPLGCPHVHFNVWLDGEYVDPFALDAIPLWRKGNWPVAAPPGEVDDVIPPTDWDHDAVAGALAACTHPASRDDISVAEGPETRAMNALFHLNYYPTRFTERPSLYRSASPRAPRLDLPFRREDFDGIWFPHGVEPPR